MKHAITGHGQVGGGTVMACASWSEAPLRDPKWLREPLMTPVPREHEGRRCDCSQGHRCRQLAEVLGITRAQVRLP